MIIINEKTSYFTAKKEVIVIFISAMSEDWLWHFRRDCGENKESFYTGSCSVCVHINVTLQGLNTMNNMSRIFITLKNLWHLNLVSKIFFL